MGRMYSPLEIEGLIEKNKSLPCDGCSTLSLVAFSIWIRGCRLKFSDKSKQLVDVQGEEGRHRCHRCHLLRRLLLFAIHFCYYLFISSPPLLLLLLLLLLLRPGFGAELLLFLLRQLSFAIDLSLALARRFSLCKLPTTSFSLQK